MCDILIEFDTWKVLIFHVYMPYERPESHTDEFQMLSTTEQLLSKNTECHIT